MSKVIKFKLIEVSMKSLEGNKKTDRPRGIKIPPNGKMKLFVKGNTTCELSMLMVDSFSRVRAAITHGKTQHYFA